jgi:hypothetical protein
MKILVIVLYLFSCLACILGIAALFFLALHHLKYRKMIKDKLEWLEFISNDPRSREEIYEKMFSLRGIFDGHWLLIFSVPWDLGELEREGLIWESYYFDAQSPASPSYKYRLTRKGLIEKYKRGKGLNEKELLMIQSWIKQNP